MNRINSILDSKNPTDSFIRKNGRIKEALSFKPSASRISRPTIKDVMGSTKR